MELFNMRTIHNQNNTNSVRNKIHMTSSEESLKGLVVTPNIQRHIRSGENYSIRDFLTNQELINDMAPFELPSMTATSDSIFIQPVKRVITTTEQYVAKWFSLDSSFKISHDHDYQYSRVDEFGWLMKLSIHPSYNGTIDNYEVKYIAPANKIKIENILPDTSIDNNHPIFVVNNPFNPSEHHAIYDELKDHDFFIQTYLQDVSRMIAAS